MTMMTPEAPVQKVYEVGVPQLYAGEREYASIATVVDRAISEGARIRIDLSKARTGVQTEFFGALWSACVRHYPVEFEAERAAKEQITLIFESKTSRAYQKYQQNFDGLFGVEVPSTD